MSHYWDSLVLLSIGIVLSPLYIGDNTNTTPKNNTKQYQIQY